MSAIKLKTNFPQVRRQLGRLRKDAANKALSMAANRTMEQARTRMKREITQQYNIRAALVHKRLAVLRMRAAPGKSIFGTAALVAQGKRAANVVAFVVRRPPNQGRKGGPQLGLRITKGAGITHIRGAFLGNKGRTVFRRTGNKRLPIAPVRTIDVPQMFNQREINQEVIKVILDRFPRIFEQQARFYASRMR